MRVGSYLQLFLWWAKLGFRLLTAIMVLTCNLSLGTDFTACSVYSIQSLQKHDGRSWQWQSPLFSTGCKKVRGWSVRLTCISQIAWVVSWAAEHGFLSLVIIWLVQLKKCELWTIPAFPSLSGEDSLMSPRAVFLLPTSPLMRRWWGSSLQKYNF